MTRAEQLRKEARMEIVNAKTKTFIQWLVTSNWKNGGYDENTLENYIKPKYEELKNNIVVIRTTKNTMNEIKEFENIEILEHKGTYYKVKFN